MVVYSIFFDKNKNNKMNNEEEIHQYIGSDQREHLY